MSKNNYYFTFGQAHKSLTGKLMKDCWVRVQATSYDKARTCFVEKFCIPYMGDSGMWSSQYEESSFRKELFPDGEHTVLEGN